MQTATLTFCSTERPEVRLCTAGTGSHELFCLEDASAGRKFVNMEVETPLIG